jgi:hypothetical protein
MTAPPNDRIDDSGGGSKVASLRVPPHSTEAEHSVLGGLLLDSSAFSIVSDVLAPADFYRSAHRLIYQAIEQLVNSGQPVDVVTVFEQLEGEAEDYGGLPYLNALAQSVPSAVNIRRYAEIVAERATLRALIAASDNIATQAFNPQGMTPADLLEQATTALRQITDSRNLRSRRLPLLDLTDLITRAAERSYLIKGLIPAASIGVLFGGSGSFKSFIALDAGLHVAHGLPWMGRRTRQGPVVYLAAEGSDELGQRADAWHRARKLTPKAPFHVVPVAVDLLTDAWRVVESVQAIGVTPSMVVIDTLSQTFGGEENSANEVAAYMRTLGARFRDLWQCAVLVIHHSGHTATERPRGSSAIQANTDYLYGVSRDEKEMLATLSCMHRKGGSPFDDATFQLSSMVLGTDSDGDKITSLVARHLSSAEEIEEAMEAEGKAGRVGKNQLMLQLAQNGMKESDLRKAFQDESGLTDAESRRRVWNRAKAWAIKAGFLDFADGYVITLKKGARTT